MLAIVIGAVVVPGLLWVFAPRLLSPAPAPVIVEVKTRPVPLVKAEPAVKPKTVVKKKRQEPGIRYFL